MSPSFVALVPPVQGQAEEEVQHLLHPKRREVVEMAYSAWGLHGSSISLDLVKCKSRYKFNSFLA